MMKYELLGNLQEKEKLALLDRQGQLYKMIWKDISQIISLLIPDDKVFQIKNHTKSLMHNLIELKTGKRVKKF